MDAVRDGTCYVHSAHDPSYHSRWKKLPPLVTGVLSNIPFAVLGALIFPAVFYVQEGNVLFGIIGAATAFLIAILGLGLMPVVLGTIGVLAVYSLFM